MEKTGDNPYLGPKEIGPGGCGVGTRNACFALVAESAGMQCSMISAENMALTLGKRLGWRVNRDPKDGKAWCPKGVLANSKRPALAEG